MKNKWFVSLILSIVLFMMHAQNNKDLPYYEIPEAPENFSGGTVLSRMVDGLGFRYYWATEGLRSEDLVFRPSEEARTTEETIDHILSLSSVILNSALNKVNEGNDFKNLTFEEKRKLTLHNLKKASDIFRESENLDDFKIVFKGKSGLNTYPLWNQINGPIADAIWHCGQVVSFRRTSGNPFNGKASVFLGKLRE
ncbi:hypothetical protein [Lutimonas zeaxanthinifaciens]|uniref:hypothetical protein n=1 Tax=Lutimonas zeaxanthinifaciens TaxID=3060215 RepID=UPI00265C9B22|nr:hypothetical protein [Lutimonas sp. YSD2104]WKK64819.1 hypothetical protein QZH61_09500 [Lutimonas sp. YSD2104]